MRNEKEVADYIEALRKILECCANPYGKDARLSKRIAEKVLNKWGRKI